MMEEPTEKDTNPEGAVSRDGADREASPTKIVGKLTWPAYVKVKIVKGSGPVSLIGVGRKQDT